MLFSLSQDGYVSKGLATLGGNGVPYVALIVSSTGMVAATLLAIFAPGRSFLLLYGIAVAGMLFVWSVILVAHLSFRSSIGQMRVAKLPIRLRFTPFSQIAALIVLAGAAVSTFFVADLKYSVPGFIPFLLGISAFYWTMARRNLKQRGISERTLAIPEQRD
jgi:amino acid transporter, AAT family